MNTLLYRTQIHLVYILIYNNSYIKKALNKIILSYYKVKTKLTCKQLIISCK